MQSFTMDAMPPARRRPRFHRVLRWSIGLAAGALVLLAAVLLVAPQLVDVPAVQRGLERRLSSAVRGEVTWEALEVRLLPVPHGVLHGARVAIPGALEASIERAELELRLRPLLRGEVEISAFRVARPALRLQLPAAQKGSAERVDAAATYRATLRTALDAAQRFMPDAELVLDEGRLEVLGPQVPPIGPLEVALRVRTDREGVAAQGTVASRYWERARLEARVESADLRAHASAEATGARAQQILELVLGQPMPALRLPTGSARVEARFDGQATIDATFGAEVPSLSLRREDMRLEAVRANVSGTARLSGGHAQSTATATLASLRLGRAGRALDIANVRLEGTAKAGADDIELALTGARLGELIPSARGTLRLAGAERAPTARLEMDALELARVREAALALAGDLPAVRDYVGRVRAGRISALRVSARSKSLDTLFRLPGIEGSLDLRGGAMRVPFLEMDTRDVSARLQLAGSTLRVRAANGQLGASRLAQANVDIVLRKPMRLEASTGKATLALEEWLAWLRTNEKIAQALQPIQALSSSADATLHALRLRFDAPAEIVYDVSVAPREVRVQLRDLPAAIVDGGTLRVTPEALTLERMSVKSLDAAARVSGTVDEYRASTRRIEVRVEEAVVDARAVDWVWQRAGLPQRLRPATPLRAQAQRIRWSAEVLDLAARVRFPAGLRADAALEIRKDALHVRRLALEDAESDAVLGLSRRGPIFEASFSGKLTDRSVVSMLAEPPAALSGNVRGDLQVHFDRSRPEETTARGNLDVDDLNLGAVLPVPVRVERADLDVDGQSLQVRELTAHWAGQKATVRGEIARRPSGLVVQAEVESPGVDLDALLPAQATEKAAAPRALWPLPLTGTVDVRAGYVKRQGLRVESLRASLALQQQRADLKVTEAALCGIAFPFSVSATPEALDANVRLSAKDQELERVAHCLTDRGILISGRFDLEADLRARGRPGDFARALQGPVQFSARNGEIRKFALIGNILSVTNVKGVLDKEVRLDRDGFDYRNIEAKGRFGGGRFTLDQGFLDSDALGLAATGTIGLDYQSSLSVLVAPFSRVDRTVRGIPIIGYVIGGAFTSVPVGVSGDIRDPLVVPLGPRAVTNELLGIFERTLKLPAKLVAPLEGNPAPQ
ncbi:MAG: AsmA-like C-terminal region-containing protein [Betaproteobacteria bacterium]|nr:AsmA-like C-terminal region-containing protein [Betaproteobacteria bacterium]MDH5219841.1 AsmA-like C-terminal region-containing protein [Betaproteobacteria bacterium]